MVVAVLALALVLVVVLVLVVAVVVVYVSSQSRHILASNATAKVSRSYGYLSPKVE